MSAFPNFTRILISLGANDKERAQQLGVSVRTLTEYKLGHLPRGVLVIAANEQLWQALQTDIASERKEAA